ncbi:MAG: hypothetical protein QW171_03400 [Candidatus Bilamarchaeaceae archaeon]
MGGVVYAEKKEKKIDTIEKVTFKFGGKEYTLVLPPGTKANEIWKKYELPKNPKSKPQRDKSYQDLIERVNRKVYADDLKKEVTDSKVLREAGEKLLEEARKITMLTESLKTLEELKPGKVQQL